MPLDADPILALSLSPATFLPGLVGTLDGSGLGSAPTLVLPADTKLVGLDLVLAFVVLDPTRPCPLRRISAPLALKPF